MRFHVDFSVVTKSGEAIGHVNGNLDCIVEPQFGDTISFIISPEGVVIPGGHEFGGLLKVQNRLIQLDQVEMPISLALENFVAGSCKQLN